MAEGVSDEVIEAVNNNQAVIYPTSTLPGLGCRLNSLAIDNLFQIKKRKSSMPVSIAVASIEQAKEIVHVPKLAISLFDSFPRGSITVILPAIKPLDERLGGEFIAIRIVSHPMAIKLIEIVGPITATSANPSGIECPNETLAAAELLGIDETIVIEGDCKGGMPSTLVKLSFSNNNEKVPATAIVMREGVVPQHSVMEWLMRKD